MNVHILHKNNSSFIANFSPKQCGKDQQIEFWKVITESAEKDFYMDYFRKSGEKSHQYSYTVTTVIIQ